MSLVTIQIRGALQFLNFKTNFIGELNFLNNLLPLLL